MIKKTLKFISTPTENSLIDSKEFFKPIITPYELELALAKYKFMMLQALSAIAQTVCYKRGREWTGEYITDFSAILPSLAPGEAINKESEREEEEPRISLIDGKLKTTHRSGALQTPSSIINVS